MSICSDEIEKTVLHQLRNYWPDVAEEIMIAAIPDALTAIERNFIDHSGGRCFGGQRGFSPYISVQWMNFLYRLSRVLYLEGQGTAADQVYYLNKIMHSIDWFYAIDLPTHFLCEHPLGSVLGRAKYGDYFFIYQGTTVGGNRKNGELFYPTIGENVILYANATVLGDTHIGNNVVVSANTYLINEKIPDNSIVFGKSPEITIIEKPELEMKQYTEHIWGWSYMRKHSDSPNTPALAGKNLKECGK